MRKKNYVNKGRTLDVSGGRKVLVVLAGLLLAVYLGASFILGEMGAVKYFRMRAHYKKLTEETARLKEENAELLGDVRSLRSDPFVIERIARDKLGLARPGEIVYYYKESWPNADFDP